jgi:hypothetical protein
MAGFGGTAGGFAAGATAAIRFFGGALVVAVLAVGLRAGDLATFVLLARAFVRGARLAATVFEDFFVVFFAAAIFVFFDFFAMLVFLLLRLTLRITRSNRTQRLMDLFGCLLNCSRAQGNRVKNSCGD